jgi:HD-like signal output (HDOD) protein
MFPRSARRRRPKKIRRILVLENSTESLRTLLATVRRLPPLPGGVARLMALSPSSSGFHEEAVAIVRADPALAAQALKIANSAMYAGQAPVATVDRALMRVGARMIATTLAEGHLKSSFDVRDDVVSHLWLVNALKANLAFTLAQRHAVGVAPEPAYTYGLLHDVGRLVLASLWRNAMSEIIEDEPRSTEDMLRREEEACGVTHALAGRLLGNRWKLPPEVVLVVAAHHMDRTARAAFPAELNRAIDLLGVVDEAVHAASAAEDGPEAATEAVGTRLEGSAHAAELDAVGLRAEQVADAIKPALAAVAKQRRALGLGAGAAFGTKR